MTAIKRTLCCVLQKCPEDFRVVGDVIVLPFQGLYINNCQHMHMLTPWSRLVLGKLTGSQLVKKFPTFYGTRRIVTAGHTCQSSVPLLSQINPVHAPPSHSWFIIILPSHLPLGLPSGLFPSRFSTKTLYVQYIFSPHTCYMPRPSHSWFDRQYRPNTW